MGKIKKGSKKFRKALTRNQDFITNSKLEKWKKALESNDLEEDTPRNFFREDFSWECKEEYGEDREEDHLHALWNCQAKSDIRNHTLSVLLIASALLPVPTHILWGKFVSMRDNITCNDLGNFANWIITVEIWKCRNKK